MDSGKREGESIINQQELLEHYITKHPELTLKKVFIDNGKTGVDFCRPAWNELMQECRAGKINCIVVKDLSRLGRNYIETGDYLERIFPMLSIRLIAVNDCYDNTSLDNGAWLISGLKNLVNDIYARDISRKVCAAMRIKQKNGDFIGASAAYGYLKDSCNKSKLVVNPETAHVVRQIFEWKAESVGNIAICRWLSTQDIPSPSKYKYQKNILKNPKFAYSTWIPETISKIIRNTTYLGHMSQGKVKEALYESKPRRKIKREDWIVVKNTHEPIVTQELFDAANAVIDERRRKYNGVIAKYLRISDKDIDMYDAKKQESNSLKNQRALLDDYIANSTEFANYEVIEYVEACDIIDPTRKTLKQQGFAKFGLFEGSAPRRGRIFA